MADGNLARRLLLQRPSDVRVAGRHAPLTLIALRVVAVLLVLVLLPTPASSGVVLNEFIVHFEPLFYDHVSVQRQHVRAKREASGQLYTQFTAHNRLFKVRLRRSDEVFAEDVVFENTQGVVDFATDNVYHGELEDDSQSRVDALVTWDGYLDATISTASEDYYIEPASRYFGPESNSSFPAVIYKGSDVRQPPKDGHCASHELYLKQWESRWTSAKPRLNQSSTAVIHQHNCPDNVSSCHYHDAPQRLAEETAAEIAVGGAGGRVIDRTLYSGWMRKGDRVKTKRRRSTIDPKKTTCMLYLQADHLFYDRLGSEKACIETMTRHVQRVNSIYRNIDFNGDGIADEINFMIKRIKVHNDQALNDPSYRFPGNYGVEKFLELFSEEDYDAFCLAYMFTYRDFEGGTLGLAWTGDLKNAGGVCEKNGHYRGSLKSLNTGIVTLLNYGKHVPPAVSHVTLAHEIGHNFGSPHDPENNRDCTPGGEDGNYIMFARATSGDKKNNNKFSPCSLRSINGVLNSKARDPKGCFTEPQSAICGNGVVEAGEECDCGWEEDCREDCCYPMRTNPSFGEKPCTLKQNRVCSPSQGPCCTDDCRLRYDVKCRDDNGCRDAAYCDGSGPQCPPSANKPNKTICNEEFVCFMGECRGSICIAYGLESCQCIPGPNDPPTKACELCCKLPGDDQPCLSSFEWNAPPYDVPDMHAKPGTPCNNYNGYCDVFQKCREVDPSGPLATLRRLLLSDESIASLKRWVQDHWYGVLFIVVGFVTLIAAIVRVFGKRANLKLRRHRRSRNAAGGATTAAAATGAVVTTTVPIAGEAVNGHIVHPVAVRAKIPLKIKVREKRSRQRKNKTARSIGLFQKKGKHSSDKTRARRSGIVNTTEKVRSWLERENPLHNQSAVDDNDSHFPSDDERKDKVPKHPDGELPQAEKPVKMKRSISECPPATKVETRQKFGRSVSQIHESDYRKSKTPTTGLQQQLGSIELEEAELNRIESQACLIVDKERDTKQPEAEKSKHQPVVARIPEPKRRMVKSSTEGKLKSEKAPSKSTTKSASFELLNFVRKKMDEQSTSRNKKSNAEKMDKVKVKAKAVGLGPVRVVLKWHGPSRLKALKRSSPAKRSSTAAKRPAKEKKVGPKRVILYKNTAPGATAAAAAAAPVTSPVDKQQTIADPGSKSADNLKVLAERQPPKNKDSQHPRRYSMQERSSKPPTLMRHQSELHSRRSSNPVEHINIDIDTDHASEC